MQPKTTPLLASGTILNDRYQIGALVSRGGQGQIFDVVDLVYPEPSYPKVVKVIPNPATARKLRTEAKKLSQMSHPGIPKIEGPSAFFEHMHEERFLLLSCLVMEKVEGINLSSWLAARDHQPISQERAIAWLKQLVDILNTVHSHSYLHRDIKPDNIMVRSNSSNDQLVNDQLVLIDFGIGREETESYYEKQQRGSLTRAGTVGYQAPEQMEGRSHSASDFYSVGRTLVHLVTGVCPSDLPKGRNYQLRWRNQASHISDYLADLIDDLMQVEVEKRDRTIQTLAKRIEFIETLPPKGKLVWRELPWILTLSGLISGFWIGVRLLGLLQPVELMAFDWMMRSRPLEDPDPRLIIIAINEGDIEYQESQGMNLRDGASLSDEALSLLLDKINFDNNIISLDLVRNFSTDPQFPNVIEALGSDRFITSCLHSNVETNDSGYTAPPEANMVGFADGPTDISWNNYKVLRRHLLMMAQPDGTPCNADYSLSVFVAMRYLFDQGFKSDSSKELSSRGQLVIGEKRFQNLLARHGPYQNLESNIQEIMLNYRATRELSEVGMNLSLIDVLSSDLDVSIFQNKIILIGSISGKIDRHNTPMENNVPGLYIQAHEISQIVSYILDDRPLINLGQPSHDMSLILIAGMAIAPLTWLFQTPWIRIVVSLGIITLNIIICLHIFWQAYWLPIIPITITIISYLLVLYFGNKYIRQYSKILSL